MATPFCPSKCPCPCTPHTCHCEHKPPCYLSDENITDITIRRDYEIEIQNNININMNYIENNKLLKNKLLENKRNVIFFSETKLPTELGYFNTRVYVSDKPNDLNFQPIVLISGNVYNCENVAVRVHDQCFTSEVLGSKKCDCKEQLEFAKKYIKENGGVVIYLQQEGRGIGLANKIAAYNLQEKGYDTVDANRELGFDDDYRTYESVVYIFIIYSDILNDLHIKSIQLMTNNPYKKICLEELGVKINKIIPIIIPPNPYDINYLHCKAQRMGHYLPLDGIPQFNKNK